MLTRDELVRMDRRELMDVLTHGHPVDPARLEGHEYRGISLGLPPWLVKLTWLVFKKAFYRDPESGVLRGWNVRMEQTGIDGPSVPKQKRGTPVTFGHYHVVDPDQARVPKGCDRGLLIHYGLGENPALDPTRRVRDPLVAVNEGNSDLLLGWSYVDLGFTLMGTPSFFTLERDGAVEFVPGNK